MRNFRLTLCYDGSRYSGWQKQGNTGNTIQEKIEAMLTRLLGQPVEIAGCGSTCRRTSARSRLRKRRRGFMRGFPARRRATSTVYGTVTHRMFSRENTSTVTPAHSIRTRCAVPRRRSSGSMISRLSARIGT